jgi:hypothetical protein
MKHTSGPWSVGNDGSTIFADNLMTDFEKGWKWGRENKRELTEREVGEMGVKDIVSFISGMIDGILNDRWRLNLIKEKK